MERKGSLDRDVNIVTNIDIDKLTEHVKSNTEQTICIDDFGARPGWTSNSDTLNVMAEANTIAFKKAIESAVKNNKILVFKPNANYYLKYDSNTIIYLSSDLTIDGKGATLNCSHWSTGISQVLYASGTSSTSNDLSSKYYINSSQNCLVTLDRKFYDNMSNAEYISIDGTSVSQKWPDGGNTPKGEIAKVYKVYNNNSRTIDVRLEHQTILGNYERGSQISKIDFLKNLIIKNLDIKGPGKGNTNKKTNYKAIYLKLAKMS